MVIRRSRADADGGWSVGEPRGLACSYGPAGSKPPAGRRAGEKRGALPSPPTRKRRQRRWHVLGRARDKRCPGSGSPRTRQRDARGDARRLFDGERAARRHPRPHAHVDHSGPHARADVRPRSASPDIRAEWAGIRWMRSTRASRKRCRIGSAAGSAAPRVHTQRGTIALAAWNVAPWVSVLARVAALRTWRHAVRLR